MSIWWSWHEAGVPNAVYGICSGDIDTVFKPTAMDVAADGSLLVAGTNPKTGRMTIERWQLALPEWVKDASSLDDPSIPPQARLSAPRRLLQKRTTVVDESVTGRRFPRMLFCPVDQHLNVAYVQFWDSKAICEFTFGDADTQWRTIADAQDLPKVSGKDFNVFWSGDHEVLGFVYVMDATSSIDGAVILLDGDRDGVVDSVEHRDHREPMDSLDENLLNTDLYLSICGREQ